jgi:hypothetical protein
MKILILFLFLFMACQKPEPDPLIFCDCGVITDTGTTSLGGNWVELATGCDTDKYMIYDTTRTWTVGEPGCVEEFGDTMNLYIH